MKRMKRGIEAPIKIASTKETWFETSSAGSVDRDMLLADDADSIQRVGQQPENEAHRNVGQKAQHVNRHGKGQNPEHQKV